jgi:D-tagatose-1,6-bisphosphate aldolase subunit GatZ/KbaZ
MHHATLTSPQPLLDMVAAQKTGTPAGVYSICSAHLTVLQACMQRGLEDDGVLLIEATCNQVNQFGGYTGLTPAGFAEQVIRLARALGFPPDRLLLGGDHLGPYPWKNEPAESAMAKSAALIQAYAAAGFSKLHLDASHPCADDPSEGVTKTVSARRAAVLCAAAEETARQNPTPGLPVYVIGTEVPTPGGAQTTEGSLQVTTPEDAAETLAIFQREFLNAGLESAWQRVMALVVQPGVEFGDSSVHLYDRQQARALTRHIRGVPGMVYEAHSTDYQPPTLLSQMVEDQFAILKVGPALTFAYREALFALAQIEHEWLSSRNSVNLSHLIETVESVMQCEPEHWQQHYSGTPEELAFKRRYSYSDRIRYYWNRPAVAQAVEALLANLRQFPPPLTLVSQFLPRQYALIQAGDLGMDPLRLIWEHVGSVAQGYAQACRLTRI